METIIQFALHNIIPVAGISGGVLFFLVIAWFIPQLRLYALIAAVLACTHAAAFMNGEWRQRAQDRHIAQQEADNAIKKGQKGQAKALAQFKENRLPDSWFSDTE